MRSENPYTTFWQWFQDNLDRFNHFESSQEDLMDELSAQLGKIDENLVYEISSADSGSRELVISADGIKESLSSVIKLTDAAPDIENWVVTAFRPRVDITEFTLRFNGRELRAKDYYFSLGSEAEFIDLILYVPGLTEENYAECVNACYLLLDMAIGEYDVVTKIRCIDHLPLATNNEDRLMPLTELPKEFDALYARLH